MLHGVPSFMRCPVTPSRDGAAVRRKTEQPRIWFDHADIEHNFDRLPHIGTRRPRRWRLVDAFLAIKSEGALDGETIAAMKGWLAQHVDDRSGFAVIEERADILVIARFLMRANHPSFRLVRPLF